MNTNRTPQQLVLDLLPRSICSVQVAAVLADKRGIFGWGWNSMGPTGYGEHAEVHCLKRSNRDRAKGAELFVASIRGRNGKFVMSKPCEKCQGWIEAYGVRRVWWRSGDGLWYPLDLG